MNQINKLLSKKKFLSLNSQFSIQSGQTLIDVLAALAILSIILTAIGTVINSAISNAQFSKNQTLATKYAQEGLETVRTIRNSNYTLFKGYNGLYCLGKDQFSLDYPQSSCLAPNLDNFIRSVRIEQSPGCGANVASVTVSVMWIDGKCAANNYCHKQVHASCLSTMNPITGP